MSINEQASQMKYVVKCKKAAEQGNAMAQNTLGFLFLNGQGVTRDYNEAVKWFRLAAEQCYSEAQYNLAIMYKLGQGVEQNDTEVIKWFQAAAEQGHGNAQNLLADMFYQGSAVPQDYQRAYMWWLLAEHNGITGIDHKRVAVAKKLTVAQIHDAEQLATKWISK